MSVTRLHACMATARMTSASSTVVIATKATRERTVNKTSMTARRTHADCSILASTSTCRISVTVLTATQAFIAKVLCYFECLVTKIGAVLLRKTGENILN